MEGRVAKTDALDAEQIAACAQGQRQRGKRHRWEPAADGLAVLHQRLRLRAQYQEPLNVQWAQRRALQEQGASEAVLAIAEQAVAQAQALLALVETQVAEWERTDAEWQPVLRRWRVV